MLFSFLLCCLFLIIQLFEFPRQACVNWLQLLACPMQTVKSLTAEDQHYLLFFTSVFVFLTRIVVAASAKSWMQCLLSFTYCNCFTLFLFLLIWWQFALLNSYFNRHQPNSRTNYQQPAAQQSTVTSSNRFYIWTKFSPCFPSSYWALHCKLSMKLSFYVFFFLSWTYYCDLWIGSHF